MGKDGKVEGKAVGIDLGTTYSCVGCWKNNAVEIIANDQGNRTTPSYVAFTDSERLVGDAAKNQVSMNPKNTVFDAKRLIGRKFSDESVQADMKHWPFNIVSGPAEKPLCQVEYKGESKTFASEEISSMILTKMKSIAENYLGKNRQLGGHHGARLLQRLAAPGDQGRRHHLRNAGAPYHQRAHGRRHRVRPR
jgi:L1 cell adhesion molecule like protein